MNRNIRITFGTVMCDLKKNTKKIIATTRYTPYRVTFFGDEDYLEKPVPAVTATYIKNSPFEKMEVKTKKEKDMEDDEAWKFIIDNYKSEKVYAPSMPALNSLDNPNDYLSELMYIPLEETNLSKN